jgi:hypothetical protein
LLDEHTVILSSRTGNFKENRRLAGFAVGAILPRAEPRGLPRKLINSLDLPYLSILNKLDLCQMLKFFFEGAFMLVVAGVASALSLPTHS